jgi:hypothetical protein
MHLLWCVEILGCFTRTSTAFPHTNQIRPHLFCLFNNKKGYDSTPLLYYSDQYQWRFGSYLSHGHVDWNNFPFQFLLHITHDKIMYSWFKYFTCILARGFSALEVRSEVFEIFDPKKLLNGFPPNTE